MKKKVITGTTIEALSRNFFKEAESYGFQYEHYLKFVNTLLEFALTKKDYRDTSAGEAAENNIFLDCKNLPLSFGRLKIRQFEKEIDLKMLTDWIQDSYGRYFLLSVSNSSIIKLENLLNNENNILGVITLDNNDPIGMVAFLNYDKESRKAELRKLIGIPELRGHGYGKEATELWIEFGRQGLKLHKIYLSTVNTNIRNIQINEELGFKVEGILRDEVNIDGKYQDVLRMSLIL